MTDGRTPTGPLQLAIIALALATALIHIALAIPTNLVMFYLDFCRLRRRSGRRMIRPVRL